MKKSPGIKRFLGFFLFIVPVVKLVLYAVFEADRDDSARFYTNLAR